MAAKSEHLVTKKVVVDGLKFRELKRRLGAKNDSEAIQQAIDQILDAEHIIAAVKRVRQRGTWVDTYGRTTKREKSPSSGS